MSPARSPAQVRDQLDREAILTAALRLVDAGGPDALSMRALAEELGVGTMSLYHYVPNKEAVNAGIAELLLSEIPVPAEGAPLDRALDMARSFYQVARAHPQCAPLLVSHPFASEGSLQPCEAALACLVEGGYEPDQALIVFRTVVAYVLGFVTMEATGFFADDAPGRDPAELARLGMGHLAEAVPLLAGVDAAAQFETGLVMVFSGCAATLG